MFRCRRPDYYRYSSTNNRHRCSLFDDAGHLAIGRYSLHCLNTLGRLRSALYFFFSLALMTFIYCLFFSEEPAGVGGLLRSRPFGHSITKKNGTIIITTTKEYNDNNNGGKAFTSQSQAPTTMKDLISRQEDFQKLLDDVKSFANRHYLDGLMVAASRSYDVQLLASEEKLNLTRYDLELSDDYVDDEVMIGEDGSTKINSTNDDEGREESEDDSNRYSLENIIERLGFNLEHIYKHNLRLNGTVTGETLNELSNRTYGLDQQQRKRRRRQQQHQFYRTLPTLFTSNSTLIIVTAVAPNQLHLALGFVRSFEMFRRSILATNSTSLALLIYDLGLEVDHRIELQTLCNTSRPHCHYRRFPFEEYPSHVANLRWAAYRSLAIQEVLRDVRYARKSSRVSKSMSTPHHHQPIHVFWLDVHYWLVKPSNSSIATTSELLKGLMLGETAGGEPGLIRAWPIMQPTSSLTHPRMFEYFHTNAESFYFHHMVRGGQLLVSVLDDGVGWTHFGAGLMLPWVHCALDVDCIAPMGSQYRSACKLNKKPHYRYSGCHHYDTSALNVVLGLAFDYTSTWYAIDEERKFFASILDLISTEAWCQFAEDQSKLLAREEAEDAKTDSSVGKWDQMKIEQFLFEIASHNVSRVGTLSAPQSASASSSSPPPAAWSLVRLDYMPSDDDLPALLTTTKHF